MKWTGNKPIYIGEQIDPDTGEWTGIATTNYEDIKNTPDPSKIHTYEYGEDFPV